MSQKSLSAFSRSMSTVRQLFSNSSMAWQCTSPIGPHSEPVLQQVDIRNYCGEMVVHKPLKDLARLPLQFHWVRGAIKHPKA